MKGNEYIVTSKESGSTCVHMQYLKSELASLNYIFVTKITARWFYMNLHRYFSCVFFSVHCRFLIKPEELIFE